jgi:hypothetical protein
MVQLKEVKSRCRKQEQEAGSKLILLSCRLLLLPAPVLSRACEIDEAALRVNFE